MPIFKCCQRPETSNGSDSHTDSYNRIPPTKDQLQKFAASLALRYNHLYGMPPGGRKRTNPGGEMTIRQRAAAHTHLDTHRRGGTTGSESSGAMALCFRGSAQVHPDESHAAATRAVRRRACKSHGGSEAGSAASLSDEGSAHEDVEAAIAAATQARANCTACNGTGRKGDYHCPACIPTSRALVKRDPDSFTRRKWALFEKLQPAPVEVFVCSGCFKAECVCRSGRGEAKVLVSMPGVSADGASAPLAPELQRSSLSCSSDGSGKIQSCTGAAAAAAGDEVTAVDGAEEAEKTADEAGAAAEDDTAAEDPGGAAAETGATCAVCASGEAGCDLLEQTAGVHTAEDADSAEAIDVENSTAPGPFEGGCESSGGASAYVAQPQDGRAPREPRTSDERLWGREIAEQLRRREALDAAEQRAMRGMAMQSRGCRLLHVMPDWPEALTGCGEGSDDGCVEDAVQVEQPKQSLRKWLKGKVMSLLLCGKVATSD